MDRIFKTIGIVMMAGLLFVSLTLPLNNQTGQSSLISITGNPIGTASVNIVSIAEITLVTSSVNFGNLTAGTTKNTTTNDPYPFHLRNDGSVKVNVTIARDSSSTPLFSGTGGGDNSSSFQFKNSLAGEGVSGDLSCSIIDWTNIPSTTPLLFLCHFNYEDSNDEVEIELMINPPSDEPSGMKSESLVFIASEST